MENSVTVRAVQTKIFREGKDLQEFLRHHLKGQLTEGCVVAVTSKIISLAENRLTPKQGITRRELVEREAEVYLGEGGYGIELTIKHGLLIPSAGIDESNSETDQYILYPEHPYESVAEIGRFLRSEFKIKRLGVILTDSHTMPLRRGVTGISLAHWGIKATQSLIGAPDIFGRPLKFTAVDVVDSLAAMAVFVMGEADNRCPLAIVTNAKVEFTDSSDPNEISIDLEDDLYYPLLKTKMRGGNGAP